MGYKKHRPFRSYTQAERYYIRTYGKQKGLAMIQEDHKDVIREIEHNRSKRRRK